MLEKPVRRRFSADDKQRLLTAAEVCTQPGALGQLLRREGLYASPLTAWHQPRDEAVRAALGRTRGRQAQEKNPRAEAHARLQTENQRLQARLNQAQTMIEVQKKLAAGEGADPGLERDAVIHLSRAIGVAAAGLALEVNRARFYRARPDPR